MMRIVNKEDLLEKTGAKRARKELKDSKAMSMQVTVSKFGRTSPCKLIMQLI